MGLETLGALGLSAGLGALTGGAGAGLGSLFGTGAGAAGSSLLGSLGAGALQGGLGGLAKGGIGMLGDSVSPQQGPLSPPQIAMGNLDLPGMVANNPILNANPLFSDVLPQSPLGKLWGLGDATKKTGDAGMMMDENDPRMKNMMSSPRSMMAPPRVDFYNRLYS